MPALRTYSLFISHSWKYGGHYYNIYNLLGQKPLFKFRNLSIPEHDPLDISRDYELEAHLVRRMKMSHVAIFIGGMYCNSSKWIKKELKYAKNHGIPIILLMPQGQLRTPTFLQNMADVVVNWNSTSLVKAIRDCSK